MLPPDSSYTLNDLRIYAENTLRANNISAPKLNAELLLCSVLKINRIEIYINYDMPVTLPELTEFNDKLNRRINGEPVQYITGFCEFYGLKINVNPSVLIPRQETELIVDKSLEIIRNKNLKKPEILDIGTGSGCISIAIASECECKITAIDISAKALETAKLNSVENRVSDRILFEKKDIFKDIENFNGFDLVIANPPYIAKDELKNLQREIYCEPADALTDYSDGLRFYRKIFDLARKTESQCEILLEMGDGKSDKVIKLAEEHFENIRLYRDYINIERVIHITL